MVLVFQQSFQPVAFRRRRFWLEVQRFSLRWPLRGFWSIPRSGWPFLQFAFAHRESTVVWLRLRLASGVSQGSNRTWRASFGNGMPGPLLILTDRRHDRRGFARRSNP